MSRGRNALVVVVSGALAALGGCRAKPSSEAALGPTRDGDRIEFAVDSPQLREIQVSPASESAAAGATLTGRLVWNEDATSRVLPPVAGRVEKLAAIGTRVRRGTVLAAISSPDFGQAQADAARAATDLASAERARERLARLFERGAAPRKDLDSAEADLARARAEAARTRARLERWGGRPGSPTDQLYRVLSPLDGVIVERNANPGQEVRPDATVPLFVVTDPSRLWVALDVTELDLPRIHASDRIELHCNAYPERAFPGRIEWIGSSLDPATRTVRVRGGVHDPSERLKAGMYVTAEMSAAPPSVSTVVPSAAVVTSGAKSYCFVRETTTRFRRVAIRLGPEKGGRVTVLSGLSPGTPVVTGGGILLASFFPAGDGV